MLSKFRLSTYLDVCFWALYVFYGFNVGIMFMVFECFWCLIVVGLYVGIGLYGGVEVGYFGVLIVWFVWLAVGGFGGLLVCFFDVC